MNREVELNRANLNPDNVKPTSLTIRRRRVGAGLAGLAVITTLGFGARAVFSRDSGGSPTSNDCPTHLVQAGETRWGIASAAHPDEDPRAAVSRLDKDNGIKKGEILRTGAELKVC